MIICPKCGYENREGLKVCLNCGYNLPQTSEASESPKEVKKEVFTEKPKKSGHGLRNLIIVIVLIFLFLLFIGGFASLSSNSTEQGGLSDSLYYIDFDGVFTVNFNEQMPNNEYSDGSTCEKYWTFFEDDYANEPELIIYYWLADKEYNLRILEKFAEPKKDGNLMVYVNNNIDQENPQYDDYLVVVSNSEYVVGFMGSDLNALKDYANSLSFKIT